jgi:hypothetical protein
MNRIARARVALEEVLALPVAPSRTVTVETLAALLRSEMSILGGTNTDRDKEADRLAPIILARLEVTRE